MTNHSARIFFPGETVPKACMTPGTRNTATQQWDSIFFFFFFFAYCAGSITYGKEKESKDTQQRPNSSKKTKAEEIKG
jgi:hypothetical protein